MSTSNLKATIKEFIQRSNKETVLMVDGKWGVGKTYFLKNLNPREFGKDKIVFVSLKGVQDCNEIKQKVFTAFWGLGKKFNFFRKAFNSATSIATKGTINISFRELAEVCFDWEKFKNIILVFDDFERISLNNISYHDMLFEIHSMFVEDKNASVIIVANEEEILKNINNNANDKDFNQSCYINAREKTIEPIVKFERSLINFFPKYINTRYSYLSDEERNWLLKSKELSQILQLTNNINLRIYNRFFDTFVRINKEINKIKNISNDYKNRFLREVLICLSRLILNNTQKDLPLEDLYLNRYVHISMFPSIKLFVDEGFLDNVILKSDLERRIDVYKFDQFVGKDFSIVRKWFCFPRQKSLSAFKRIIPKSHRFANYDLFLETMRYLKWFYESGMMEEKLYQSYKEKLLQNFERFLLKMPDINLSITGMAAEGEFIDVLNRCKDTQVKQKFKRYEKELFNKNKVVEDAEFVEFVRQHPIETLDMYTKNIKKVVKISSIYNHVKVLSLCVKHSFLSHLVTPNHWANFIYKMIDNLDNPTGTAVTKILLDEVLFSHKEEYKKLCNKLEIKKQTLLKKDKIKKANINI